MAFRTTRITGCRRAYQRDDNHDRREFHRKNIFS